MAALRHIILAASIAFGVVGLSTLAPSVPVYAATPTMAKMTCQHAPTLTSLHTCVLRMIHMKMITNRNLASMLLYSVDDAQMAADQGWNGWAVRDMQIVIALVRDASGHGIVAAHATMLILHAQRVMQALEKLPPYPADA